jgi:hypothetical protein
MNGIADHNDPTTSVRDRASRVTTDYLPRLSNSFSDKIEFEDLD